MDLSQITFQVALIGAGPIGLEMAIALKNANISYIHFEKAQAAQMIYNFPPQTRFFSSSERISISGIPIQTLDQQKCSREEYLAYIRTVILQHNLKIHTYTDVTHLEKLPSGLFQITTPSTHYQAHFILLATGGTATPRTLDVPGENLPHVSAKFEDPHKYFRKKVLIIGGKNSAVETALRCYHAYADVTIASRRPFSPNEIKYWLLPELTARIQRNEIKAHLNCHVTAIRENHTTLSNKLQIPTDFVIKAIGFNADMSLFKQLNITLSPDDLVPNFNPTTMETNTPNAYVLGTAIGGSQKKYRVFIENTHEHVTKILQDISQKLNIPYIEPQLSSLAKRETLEE